MDENNLLNTLVALHPNENIEHARIPPAQISALSELPFKWIDVLDLQWMESRIKKYAPELVIVHITDDTGFAGQYAEYEFGNEISARFLPGDFGVKVYLSRKSEISCGYHEIIVTREKYKRMKLKKKIAELVVRIENIEKNALNSNG